MFFVQQKVAIVILNWNGTKLLSEFLPSVVNTAPSYAKIYVADNASTDDSLDYLSQNYPNVSILLNDKNYGFAEGYNKCLTNLKEEYLVLLNSDVACTDNWVEPIIDLMDSNDTIGACQPKILDYKNKEKFEYAGAAGGFIDAIGFPFCRGRIFNSLENDENQYNDNIPVFWATGACFFVRNKIFKELEGFDVSFFAHMEEIDLCWRIQRLGFEIYCVPNSTVYHLGGGTLNKINPKKTYLNFRNNLIMLIKNVAPKLFVFKIITKLFLDGIAGVKFLLEGSPLHTFSILKAHLVVYSKLPVVFRERRKLKKKYGYVSLPTMYPKAIVISHFVKRKNKFKDLDW